MYQQYIFPLLITLTCFDHGHNSNRHVHTNWVIECPRQETHYWICVTSTPSLKMQWLILRFDYFSNDGLGLLHDLVCPPTVYSAVSFLLNVKLHLTVPSLGCWRSLGDWTDRECSPEPPKNIQDLAKVWFQGCVILLPFQRGVGGGSRHQGIELLPNPVPFFVLQCKSC